MRKQLISYVELLFAGTADCEDMKQEVLQNTLERYDDLVSQGKNPEAAYRLAISAIGDISELLGTPETADPSPAPAPKPAAKRQASVLSRVLRAIAIMLYIICPVPLFVLSEMDMSTIGLCGLLAIVAVATALMVIAGVSNKKEEKSPAKPDAPLYRALSNLVLIVGIIAYFVLSFATGAWYITWIIFPLIGATNGLVKAIFDLRRATK